MFKKFWYFISKNGIDPAMDHMEQKRIKLSNQLIFYSAFFTLLFLFFYAAMGLRQVYIIETAALVIYMLLFSISWLGYFKSARFLFILILNVHMYVLSLCFGFESEMQLVFIPIAAVPLVIYNLQDNKYMLFGVFLSTMLFCSFYVFDLHSVLQIDLDPELLPRLRFLFNITSISCEVIVLYSIINNYNRTERRLDENNELLQQQLQAIFENSFDALFLVDWKKRKFIKANKRAMELFEVDAEEQFYSLYVFDLRKEQPTEFEMERMHYALNTTGLYESEVLYKTRQGKEFWGALAIKLVKIGNEKYQSVRVTDITVEKKAKAHVERSLHEKEILLSEIHHRVKNNMAVISGLLGLQSSYVEDERSRLLFEESRNRIHSMALIHDKLYQHETFARIDFNAYCNDLVNYIKTSYNASSEDISYSISCTDVFIDIKNAVPCGLILNELISNIYKHAFSGRTSGAIKIVCTKMGGKFTMMVSDNGIGFEAEKTIAHPVSLGLTLITALVEQMSGNLKVVNKEGTTYYISFEE